MSNQLRHLAIIMDGNNRWAVSNDKSAAAGHKAGAENIVAIAKATYANNIKHLTLYAFSAENWDRPAAEVSHLMSLMAHYVNYEVKRLHENNIRLHVIGDLDNDNIKPSLRKKIEHVVQDTSTNTGLNLYLAFSYGGRQEIVSACKKFSASAMEIDELTTENFSQFLYNAEMPDVDLFIRTGGDYRISNFLLWQISYAELYFTDAYWPDFCEKELIMAIDEFKTRLRRFGKRIK